MWLTVILPPNYCAKCPPKCASSWVIAIITLLTSMYSVSEMTDCWSRPNMDTTVTQIYCEVLLSIASVRLSHTIEA